jgi:glutaminyl-peptide cyclotransferase
VLALTVTAVAATTACDAPEQAAPTTTPVPSTTSLAPTDAAGSDQAADPGEDLVRYEGALVPDVVAVHPHDTGAFTQGLEWYGGHLLESTGLEGESSLRLVDPATGQAEQLLTVDDDLFAEGVTVFGEQAIQLTWQDETLLVTDLPDLVPGSTSRRDAAYRGEGWGLCYDGNRLVMSDGSDRLTFRDPATFEVVGEVEVVMGGEPLTRLNELECVGDQVWANVWLTTLIVAIDPATGEVEATVDASGLVPEGYADDGAAVLNGIAFEERSGRFWLTGKRWPVVYEVDLVPDQ